MDFITVAEKLARLFCYSVIFTLVESRHRIKGQLEYCYEARIKELNLTALGIGPNTRKARQDSARRLTICLISDFQKELLSVLSSSPEQQQQPSTAVPQHQQPSPVLPPAAELYRSTEEREMERMLDSDITSPQEFQDYMTRKFPNTQPLP
jgi:hypothetical protein